MTLTTMPLQLFLRASTSPFPNRARSTSMVWAVSGMRWTSATRRAFSTSWSSKSLCCCQRPSGIRHIFLVKARSDDAHALGIGRAEQPEGFLWRAGEPGCKLHLFGKQHRRSLMIDRLSQSIRQCRHEGKNFDLDVGTGFLDRSLPLPVDARKGEQWSLLLTVEGEPVPASRLAFVGLAEGGRRHQAAPMREAVLPEFALHLVVACIGHPLGGIAVAKQDEPPAAQHEPRARHRRFA